MRTISRQALLCRSLNLNDCTKLQLVEIHLYELRFRDLGDTKAKQLVQEVKSLCLAD